MSRWSRASTAARARRFWPRSTGPARGGGDLRDRLRGRGGGRTSGGGGFVEDRVSGGRATAEGRQFGALIWAERLRALEAAIGPESVRVTVQGDAITVRDLVRAIVVGGLSLPRVLAGLGLKRSTPREVALKRAALAAFDRMAQALPDGFSPISGNRR